MTEEVIVIERSKAKYHFVIVGSGWRSLYYVRIAKALPDMFCLDAMYCRTEEKALMMSEKYDIHTTTSIQECEGFNPDFVVVVVNKASIADVSIEWMNKGFTVLCETPASLDEEMLDKLWALYKSGKKLVVAEQYFRYPSHMVNIDIMTSGIIGDISCMNISLAHEYHGASLMRAYMGIDIHDKFKIRAKSYNFPTTETLTRYEKFTDGRVAEKMRVAATFEFESGKVAFYDFDSEQYRSPIRKNTLKVQGVRGEMIDDTVVYLDGTGEPVTKDINTFWSVTSTSSDNPNLSVKREIKQITFGEEVKYEPLFGLCGLSEDETAIATLMKDTAEYSRNNAKSPYSLEYALQDAYMAILLSRAVQTGLEVESEDKAWLE